MTTPSSEFTPRTGFDVNSFLKKTMSNYDVEKAAESSHAHRSAASSSPDRTKPDHRRRRSSGDKEQERRKHRSSSETRTISSPTDSNRARSIPTGSRAEQPEHHRSPSRQRNSIPAESRRSAEPQAIQEIHHYAKRSSKDSSRKERNRKPVKQNRSDELKSRDEVKQLIAQGDFPRELYHPEQSIAPQTSQPYRPSHPHNQGFPHDAQAGHPDQQGTYPSPTFQYRNPQGVRRELMPVLNSDGASGFMKMSPSRASLISGTSTLRPACRICQVSGEDSDELISPCRCSGTMQFVHAGCLVHWLEISTKKMHPSPHCELCGYRYQAHHCCSLRRLQYPECSPRDRALHFVFLLVFIVMLGCAALSILYLQADGGNRLRTHLSLDDIVVITCSLLFFCSFFVAVFTQYRSESSLCRLFLRCWLINRHWRIKNYDRRDDPEYPAKIITEQPQPL